MRTAISVLLIGLALAPCANAASADDDEIVRDPRNIVFEGVKSFDPDAIRKRLAIDIDVQVAGHPQNALANYLQKLEEVLRSGYRTSGFQSASIEARFDPKRRRVIVRIQEGRRSRCSKIRVAGLDHEESQELVAELIQEVPPANAVPLVVARDDGTTRTVWETPTGSPAKLLNPAWKVGEPFPFDGSLEARVEKRLTQWFWERGRVLTRFHVWFRIEDGSDDANLVVAVDDPGVPATIGEIEVQGAAINTPENVLEYLAIRPGMPFDGRIEARLQRRLWESGRFINGEFKKAVPVRTGTGARVDLTLIVSEHPKATPLATPFAPYQQALLKLRDWVVQWTEEIHDEDLVFDAQVDSSFFDEEQPDTKARPHALGKIYDLHVVASPGKGLMISVDCQWHGKSIFAQTFIVRGRQVIFYSPLTETHLEIEHSNTTQLTASIAMSASKPKSPKDWGTSINMALPIKWLSSGNATPVKLKAELAPLSVLLTGMWMTGVECKSRAGIVTVRAEGWDFQIDEKTGRLVRFQADLKDLGKIRCRLVRGELNKEFERQDRLLAHSSNVYDAKESTKSLAVYWIDEYRRIIQDKRSPDEQQSLAALHKLCQHWPIESVGTLFDQFDAVDRSPDAFALPTKQIQGGHPVLSMFNFDGAGTLAGYLLPIYRELVPREGWFWPLGRDGLFALIGRQAGTWEQIGQYRQLVDSGPFGHLMGAVALAPFSPRISQQLASHALQRLSVKSLRADYAPLLAGDSWLGRNLLSLAQALRHLDDSEIRALVRLLPDEPHHPQITYSLLLLKADPRMPVHDVLPFVCDQLWKSTMKPPVETALKALAAGQSLERPRLIKDVKIKRTSGSN
jgi:hypothetical protein